MAKTGKIELYRGGGGWRYRVKAGNGRIVEATEEGLKQFTYALRRVVKKWPDLPVYKETAAGVFELYEAA